MKSKKPTTPHQLGQSYSSNAAKKMSNMKNEGRLFTDTDNSNLLECDYEDLIARLEEQVENQENMVNE